MAILQINVFATALFACFLLTAVGSGANEPTRSSDGKPLEKATFAGGCFWCMEPPFKTLDGVVKVVSGYTGGTGANPNYGDYAQKGHVEAIEVTYDPSAISYSHLLDVFWRQIDPTDAGGQFADRGPHYRTAIFYHSEGQKALAEKSKKEVCRHCDNNVEWLLLPERLEDYNRARANKYYLHRDGGDGI